MGEPLGIFERLKTVMPESYKNNDTLEILKVLADESRLKIIGILLKKDSYSEYLAYKLNLSTPTVTYHMNKLKKAGIVKATKIQHYIIYSLNYDIMNMSIEALIKSATTVDDSRTYEEKVIESFFEYGKLKQIPAQQKKREIVMAYIASKFELNKIYSELEVVATLLKIHDDYITIKRDLIGMGFLEDLNMKYRRIK